MMSLVCRAKSLQDLDALGHLGLLAVHALEPAFECGILLNMLRVLICCGCPNHLQLTTRKRGFQKVGRVHGGVCTCSTSSDNLMDLVDEEADVPLVTGHLVDDLFQTVFKLPTVLRASDKLAQVERVNLLPLQAIWHLALGNANGQAFDHCSLPDARRTHQASVVLTLAQQDLDDPIHLLLPTNHWIQQTIQRHLRQICGNFIQRHVGLARLIRPDGRELSLWRPRC
mmetsp:Transcript_58007/g.135770  ORF Transcript_58007/g.135770 Transcript_58007/m.135770 type:complete len:227 (-) Transcript_58007:631-1311(-)